MELLPAVAKAVGSVARARLGFRQLGGVGGRTCLASVSLGHLDPEIALCTPRISQRDLEPLHLLLSP